MKLLVVDDELGVRSLIQIVLEEAGHETRVASNGREAVHVAEFWQPDLVIMDLRMPVMNGVEALKAIRKSLPAIKAILMTAYSNDEWIRQAKTLGISSILSKPFDVEILKTLVAGFVAGEDSAV